MFGNTQYEVFTTVSNGNRDIFLDVAWVTLAYQRFGMKELEAHKASINPVMYQGFVELDQASREKDPIKKLELAKSGNKKLVFREQSVLQGVLDSVDKKVVRQLGKKRGRSSFLFDGGNPAR